MKFNSIDEVKDLTRTNKTKKPPNPAKLAFVLFSAVLLLFFMACQKSSHYPTNSLTNIMPSQKQILAIDGSIKTFFNMKKDFALHFDNRESIGTEDIFISDEIKQAVRYQLMSYAEFGMITNYSHEVHVFTDKMLTSLDGSIIIPAIEKVESISNDPSSEPAGPTKSAYTDKLFFRFAKQNDEWKLSGVEILKPEFDINSEYSQNVVNPFIVKDFEAQQKAVNNEELMMMYEHRKVLEMYFNKVIDKETFDDRFRIINEKYNVINNLNLQLSTSFNRSQRSLNKNNVVWYATHYTDDTGGDGVNSYNNGTYKVFIRGKDCANFASQCLKYGGWQYANSYTNASSYSSWWYNSKSTSTTSDDVASSSWTLADGLCNYICEVNHYANYTTPAQVSAGVVGLADLIWTPKMGRKGHVMIVTSVSHPTPSTTVVKYSAHSNNRLNAPMYSTNDAVYGHFN